MRDIISAFQEVADTFISPHCRLLSGEMYVTPYLPAAQSVAYLTFLQLHFVPHHTSVFTRDSLKGVRTMLFYCTLELLKPMILEHYKFS